MDPKYEAYLLNEKGCQLCKQGKHEEGLEALVRATELDANNTDAWYSKAGCLYSLGRPEEALHAYVRVLRLNPYDEMTKRMAVAVEAESGFKNSDLNDYLTAFECNEFGVKVQRAYQPGKQEEEKLEIAIAFYNKAIELEASFAEAFNNRGSAYKRLGRYEDALGDYEQAIAIKPHYAIAWFNKGQCYLDLVGEDIDAPIKALQCFEQVLELDPEDLDAREAIETLRNF